METYPRGSETEAQTEGRDLLLQEEEAEVGEAVDLLPGKKVVMNKRTDLPFLKGKGK